MMINSPYHIYQQSSVQTANGEKLVIMLYEGAIRFTKMGIEGVRKRRYDIANNNFIKAQAIINELIAALDFEFAISKDLVRIYEYLLHCLIQANIQKRAVLAEEVVSHLQDLLDSWKQIVNKPVDGRQQAAGETI